MATAEVLASDRRKPRRWEWLAPAGALGFLLTVGLGAVAIGATTPDGDAPAREIANYFAEHRGGHLIDAFLVSLGGFVFYPWFLSSLWRGIRRVESDDGLCAPAALVGGVTLLGPLLILVTAWGAAALKAGPRRDPAVAAGLFDLGNVAFLLFPLPASLLVLATTLAGRLGGLLPTWLDRLGWPFAVVMVLAIPFGLSQLSFVLFSLWLALVALVLLRDGRRSIHAEARR